ncbi:MAG: flagellar basal-body rod protein FlgG [Rhodospirillales bacterium]
MSALAIASTGMLAQQYNVEIISNNLANMNTTAFKRQRAEFQDLLYQDLVRVGSQSSSTGTVVPSGVQLGVGVKLASVYRVGTAGSLSQTSNQLDLAIQGKGFFQVRMPNGETAYTRAGAFQMSPTGEIVTASGYTVEPGITVPTDTQSVTINPNGEVIVKLAGQVALQNVGQLQIATFPNESGLEARGDNLYVESPSSGAAAVGTPGALGYGSILQGYLENSNVNAVDEITSLISAQRAYEMLARVIEKADQMSGTLSQMS